MAPPFDKRSTAGFAFFADFSRYKLEVGPPGALRYPSPLVVVVPPGRTAIRSSRWSAVSQIHGWGQGYSASGDLGGDTAARFSPSLDARR